MKKKINNKTEKITVFGFFVILFSLCVGMFFYLISAPVFEKGKIITIPSGYSIKEAADLLEVNGIIRSGFLASGFMRYKKLSPKSGPYEFKKPEDMFSVVGRVVNAQYGNIYKNITIPEGSTNKQLIVAIKKSSIVINENTLTNLIFGKEGFLFPDTYSFLPDASEEDIINKLEETFLEKIELAEKNKIIQKTRDEIVIMASILEKEASNDLEQKQIISGILWKRISIGMFLQVDAPFLYERGKGSAQLSNQDLQQQSLYNTYTNKGLTPTPIGNPGYDSLYAAAHPIESNYLFYLHGRDGRIYYGKDYSEHLKNKRIYLK